MRGQRRYVESLSAYRANSRNDAEAGRGTISRACRRPFRSSRRRRPRIHARPSAGDGINDYMRLLWARVGIPYSPATACRSRARRSARWWIACSPCPSGQNSICLLRWCAAARRISQGNRRIHEARLPAPQVDGQFSDIADARRSIKNSSTTLTCGRRIVVRPIFPRVWPKLRDRARTRRWSRTIEFAEAEPGKRRKPSSFLRNSAVRIGVFDFGNRAPAFLFQQSFRRLSKNAAASASSRRSTRADRPQSRPDAEKRRRRALGQIALPYYAQTLAALGPNINSA